MSQVTHLVLLRAADADPDGPYTEAKFGHESEPTQAKLEEYREGIEELFTQIFGRPPGRVGVAVLPWVEELDEAEIVEASR